jgi:hypothetical protein
LSGQRHGYARQKAAILINGDVTLAAYFQSMLAYFTGTSKPSETLLTLKLKELIVSILWRQESGARRIFSSLLAKFR